MILFIKGKKTIQAYMALCEKITTLLVKSWSNFGQSHFWESWVQFHWPHPGLIIARPVKSRDHINRTRLTKTTRSAGHHATIQWNSGTDEKQSNWHPSVWKRFTKPFLKLWYSSEPQLSPVYLQLSTDGKNVEQWWTFKGERQKLPQENSDDSSKKPQKNPTSNNI